MGIIIGNYGTNDDKDYGVSVLSLVTNITDILVEKRLSFLMDEDDPLKKIIGVKFLEKSGLK